jgi:hypothetical protein
MNTVEVLEKALALAKRAGCGVRYDWEDGEGCFCRIQGKPWIFLNAVASPAEHLSVVRKALEEIRREKLESPEDDAEL